jgi:hypothetical protein
MARARWSRRSKRPGRRACARSSRPSLRAINAGLARREGQEVGDGSAVGCPTRSAWSALDLRWAKADLPKVPEHWRTFGTRASPLTGNPRLAANPANAILNYLYALVEAGARLTCLAIGLDPGLGILHADLRARDSLALDVMEPVRPEVDAYVLGLLGGRTFRWADFIETRQGGCRIVAPLTHELAATLPSWEARLAPIVEGVARAIASGPNSRVRRLPTLLTGSARSAGRDSIRRRTQSGARPQTPSVAKCRTCGTTLPDKRSIRCDACRPGRQAEQRAELRSAGVARLAELRAIGITPSNSVRAQASRRRKEADNRRLAGEWERSNGTAWDPGVFRREVLEGLAGVSAAEIARATRLSRPYCSDVLAGRRVPHPRWWARLQSLRVELNQRA